LQVTDGARLGVSSEASASFVAHLESFAGELSASDGLILMSLLTLAMGPWERASYRADSELLSDDERQLLYELTDMLGKEA